MGMMNALFAVILLEGFIVLAVELVAIRQLVPFVGSSTDIVAIVIAAVLMPLSLGYFAGGRFTPKGKKFARTFRKKLMQNMLVASVFFAVGISYISMVQFFAFTKFIGVENELLNTAIYSIIFLVYPVFLMGQTIPLVTNYFKYHDLPKITGKILFFSTIGSFCGSIVSTIVLMSTIGVHNTVIVIFGLIAVVVNILGKREHVKYKFASFIVLALVYLFNNSGLMARNDIVSNNAYSMIKINKPEPGVVDMNVNHSDSSRMAGDYRKMYRYVKLIESIAILPTLHNSNIPPQDILVLGAGGLTIGAKDNKNTYTYVDIDPNLKDVSEKYMLEAKLGKNKKFVAEDARAFMLKNKKKYDIVVVDLYSTGVSIPSHLITKEFYQSVKGALKVDGMVAMNIISSVHFDDAFSRNVDTTIKSVFPYINRLVSAGVEVWGRNKNLKRNVVYFYLNHEGVQGEKSIYTDNLNTYFLDK